MIDRAGANAIAVALGLEAVETVGLWFEAIAIPIIPMTPVLGIVDCRQHYLL